MRSHAVYQYKGTARPTGSRGSAEGEHTWVSWQSTELGHKLGPVGLLSCSGISGLLGDLTWKVLVLL